MGLFARDGHILDLGLERYLAEELSAPEGEEVEAHLSACAACQQRVDHLRRPMPALPPLPALRLSSGPAEPESPPPAGEDPPQAAQPKPAPTLRLLPKPPPEPPAAAAPEARPARRTNLYWITPLLAAAVVLLVYIGVPDEDFVARGGGSLQLEVYRDQTGVSERLLPGGTVRAGDRLAFRVQVPRDGFLLVAGTDGRENTYACYPTGDNPAAAPVVSAADPQALPAAIELDESPGEELLFAVFCSDPFDLSTALRAPLPKGCSRVDVPLKKAPP